MIGVGRIVCIGPSKTPPSFSPRHPLDMQTVQNPLFRQFPTIYWFVVNLTPRKTTLLSLNISDFSFFYLKTELPLHPRKNHPLFPSNPPLTMGGHPKNKTLLKWELRYCVILSAYFLVLEWFAVCIELQGEWVQNGSVFSRHVAVINWKRLTYECFFVIFCNTLVTAYLFPLYFFSVGI